MRRSRTTILKQYETFVKAFEKVVKVLKWKTTFKQEIDQMLLVIIDDCTYTIGPQTNSTPEFPLYYLSVMVQYHGNRDEPPSEDEKELSGGVRHPHHLIHALIDAHWIQKREWVTESTILTEDFDQTLEEKLYNEKNKGMTD